MNAVFIKRGREAECMHGKLVGSIVALGGTRTGNMQLPALEEDIAVIIILSALAKRAPAMTKGKRL